MEHGNLFLKSGFLEKLSDKQYEAVLLLVRILGALRLTRKVLYVALESRNFRNFEIVELNSNLLSTYTECAKAYCFTIASPIFSLLGIQPDSYTKSLIGIYRLPKEKSPVDYQVISFIRDTTTFHFRSGYMANHRTSNGDRIAFMELADLDGAGSVFLTNSIPHILEKIQRISGRDLSESSIIHYFRQLNEQIVYPFIDHLDKLVHDVIGKELIVY